MWFFFRYLIFGFAREICESKAFTHYEDEYKTYQVSETTKEEVRIHYRSMRLYPESRVKFSPAPIAHWALQVGDYVYELALPSLDEGLHVQENEVIASKGKGIKGLKKLFKSKKSERKAAGTGNKKMELVEKIDGKVPLLISEAKTWCSLDVNRNAKVITIGETRMDPVKTKERAIHIFKTLFQKKYNIFTMNCQAFVLFLFIAIKDYGPVGHLHGQDIDVPASCEEISMEEGIDVLPITSEEAPSINRYSWLSHSLYDTWCQVTRPSSDPREASMKPGNTIKKSYTYPIMKTQETESLKPFPQRLRLTVSMPLLRG